MEGASGLEALVYHADGELRLGIIPKRKLLSVPGISREYVRIEWERLFQRPGPYVFTGIRGVLGDWNTSLPAGRRLAEKEAGFPAEAVENKLCRGLSCGNGGTVFRLRHLFGAQRLQSVIYSTFKEEAW